MDENKQVPQPDDESWLDDLLTAPDQREELLPDEQAMSSAGLTHPSDAELEQILQEVRADMASEAPVQPELSQEPQPEPFRDAEYRDTFGEGEDLEEIFSGRSPEKAPAEDPFSGEPEVPQGPKGRPKRKKGSGLLGIPHFLATTVWICIILAIGIALGRMIWLAAADVLAFGRPDQQVVITIDRDDQVKDIAGKLKDAGLIKYPELFEKYVELSHKADRISPGTFTLNARLDYMALVNAMNTDSDSRNVVEVVIPEGYSCREIFALLEENAVCSAADLENWAASGELADYWFLKDVTRGDKYCLEGFLFPDTYQFYTDDEPQRVLEKFLDNFEYRFSQEMVDEIQALNERLSQMMADNGYDESYIQAHQADVRTVVTIASLIEEETANTLESYTISSVIYNRLCNAAEYPYLNIDATILYALGYHKSELSSEDLQIDSPYNTYTHTGLTPGPITNPGLYSIYAALDPDDSDFYYYAMDPDTGAHHFSRNASEHDAFLDSLDGD